MAANNDKGLTRLMVGCVRLTLRWPRATLLVLLALVAGMAFGGSFIQVSGDYRAFFDKDNPELKALDHIEETYAKLDSIALVLRYRDGDLFTPERLEYLADLTDRLWQIPNATRVESLTNYQHTWAENDELMVADLVPLGEPVDEEFADRARAIALHEPTLVDYLVSKDGATTSLVVTLHPEEDDKNGLADAVRAAKKLVAEDMAAHPDLRIAVVGGAPLDLALRDVSERDARILAPVMVTVVLVGLALFFKGWRSALIVVMIVFATVSATMGIMGYLGIPMMTATAAVPVIVLTITVADAIHLITAVQSSLARRVALEDAIEQSVRVNAMPVFITSVTTMAGFLSLNFADAPPYRDVGNLATIGSALALICTLVALPPLMMLMPPPSVRVRGGGSGWFLRLHQAAAKHPYAFISVFVALLLAAMAGIPTLAINDKFVDYFAPGVTFRDDAYFATEYLPGLYAMEFSVPSGQEGGIAEPAYLQRVDAFAKWLEEQPGVTHVVALPDIMRRLNRNMHDDEDTYYRLPDSRELAAQYLLLYEMSLPYGRDMTNQIDIAKSASRVTAVMDDISTADMQALKVRAEQWLNTHSPPGLSAEGTGVAIIFAYLTERTVKSMLLGTGMSVLGIALCLLVSLRSVPLTVLALVIQVIPIVLTFGLWAYTKGEIGLYAAAVVSIALGLIVDFAIHLLSKYQSFRVKGDSVHSAMARSLDMVGPALVVSAVVLIGGFAVLLLANFTLNANLGAMTALMVAAALITDLIMLPALLYAGARLVKEKAGD